MENKNNLKSRDNPVDYFFSNLLVENLKKEIGLSEYGKIKKRFQSKFKLPILSAFTDFSKIDGILREIFGRKTDKIEQEIIQKSLSKVKRGNDVWIVTDDILLSSILLESYGDAFKKSILDLTSKEDQVVYEIIKKSDLPIASGYRRIGELVQDGLLTEIEKVSSGDLGRNATKYSNIIKHANIYIQEEDVQVEILFKRKFLNSCFILSVL